MAKNNFNSSNDIEVGFNTPSYLFTKIHILSTKFNLKSVVLLKIKNNEKILESLDAVSIKLSQFTDPINTSDSWLKHKEYISKKKFSAKFDNNLTLGIITEINNLIDSTLPYENLIEEILKKHEKNETNSVGEILKPYIGRVILDKSITIQVNSEFVLQKDINDSITIEDKPKEQAFFNSHRDDFFDINDGALLSCAPVVAPVHGTPIFNLRVNDQIMVKILKSNVYEEKLKDLFDLITSNGESLYVPGKVVKIRREDSEYSILVKIEDKVFGKIFETEQIKFKVYQDKSNFKNEPHEITEKHKMWITFSAISVGILLILIVFAYIFYF